MISDKMKNAIADQINAEIFSSYLYLSMRAWLDANDLPGFANWMYIQSLEELSHAEKFYKYLVERGAAVEMAKIDAPQTQWDSPLAVAQAILEHEQKVTSLINNLVDVAIEEKDHATRSMLQWFVDEQVEEESNAMDMVRKIKMVQDAPGGLFMLDNELASRVFTPPASEGE